MFGWCLLGAFALRGDDDDVMAALSSPFDRRRLGQGLAPSLAACLACSLLSTPAGDDAI